VTALISVKLDAIIYTNVYLIANLKACLWLCYMVHCYRKPKLVAYNLPIIHEDLIIYSNVLPISAFVVAGLPQTSPDKSTVLLYKDNRRHEIRFGL